MTDVLIVGGGIIGLSVAIELAQHGASVTVLERDACGHGATWAAAGMLAPEAEGLTGAMRELGLRSRELYPKWIRKLSLLAGDTCGYWCCGILKPVFCDDPHLEAARSQPNFLDRTHLQQRQPDLGEAVAGALWFPEDGQVDSRRLATTLVMAAKALGVRLVEGASVYRIATAVGRVARLETSRGDMMADRYVLATGAWARELLPVSIAPRKGQMLSLFDPERRLQRVLFGPRAYIVPRQDGTIVVGATVEDVGFTPGNTAEGIGFLLREATTVFPYLNRLVLQSTWWGFRPYAPEERVLLGPSAYENLDLAIGHYRNGILLAPITGQLLSDWIRTGTRDPLLEAFALSSDRPFLSAIP